MTPVRKQVENDRAAKPTLDSSYKDLSLYTNELGTKTFDIAHEQVLLKQQPSFVFKLPSPIEEYCTSRFSSMSNEISLKRYRSGQSYQDVYTPMQLTLVSYEEESERQASPAFLSDLSIQFVSNVKALCNSRDIFCSTEYPTSFTGEEAIDMLCEILPNDWSRKEYKRVALSFMHSVPPLFSPVAYANKSLRNDTIYDSPKEAYALNEQEVAHQGLIVPFLECYTPLCIKYTSNGCYAPLCPNKGSLLLSKSSIINEELHRNISLSSSAASSQDTTVSRCWSLTVSRETLQKTPAKEMKRQEAIYELIYTEEDYVRDLNLLDELFAKPLLTAQCIEPHKRQDFFDQVFGNYMEIVHLHRDMYRELRDHQLTSLDTGFVDEIGAILIKYVDQFMAIYTKYGPHFVMAEDTAKEEIAHNILFHNYIREKEKQAETRKLPFRHFIILPITRLLRYPILLDAIVERTTVESEKQNLVQYIDRIRDVAKAMDALTNETKQFLRLKQINEKIKFKATGQQVDLELLKRGRKLVYEGVLKRRSSHLVDSVELYVFLFDHVLLMTKPKRSSMTGAIECYTVSKNPIPLNLLLVNDVAENFFYSTIRATKGGTISRLSNDTTISLQSLEKSSLYINQPSLMIRHLGRYGGEYLLYTETSNSRIIWKEKILATQSKFKEQEQPVFKLSTISDLTFAQSGTMHNYGKVTCAAQFEGEMGQKMVVLGASQGVWIGKEGDALKRVLLTPDVTQIGVLQAQNILLVLADKELTAYPVLHLYAAQPTMKKGFTDGKSPISSRVLSTHVAYFNVGTCNDRTLVITMRKKGSDSHFKALEPICGNLKSPKNSKYLTNKTSFMSKPPAWFKTYKEFYIGTDSTAVHFLKSKVLVACSKGFEVIDLENLSAINTSFPDLKSRDYRFIADARPLSIFKCNEKSFMLCYDKFAFLMSSHGDYIKDKYKKIDWISNPQSVAFSYPYILAFDPKFIEIRQVDTGKLVQVITGDNMRYLPSSLNKTNAAVSAIYGSITHQFKSEYQKVFKLEPLYS